jgi:capsular exopolysaccharide synthesis family protein
MSGGYGEALSGTDELRIGEILRVLARQKLLITAVTLLVTLAAFAWIATRQPRYEARATLLLEKEEGGVLSELASLASEPAAEAEIALIQSRSLAEVTCAPPASFRPKSLLYEATEPDFDPFAMPNEDERAVSEAAARGDPSAMESLGLAWVVERHDLRPWRSILRGLRTEPASEHRLRASIERVPGTGAPAAAALDVLFLDEDTVRVTPHGGFVLPEDDGETVDFVRCEPFEVLGHVLRLDPCGDHVGQRYRLQRRSDEEAVLALMANTEAEESGRKTNVVHVTVEDFDPHRAAETANALSKNYIRRSVRIGQQKATQTVRFIDAQLEAQLAALAEAERAVVEVQSAYPETIALSESATALVDRLSELQLQEIQLRLARTALDEALGYLERGDHAAVARLGQEVPNLLALAYITELGTLEAEALRLQRTDVLGYKALLIAERHRITGLADANRLNAGLLEGSLAALTEGDSSAIARLGGVAGTESGADFGGYADEIARIDGELSRLRGAFLEGNPMLGAMEDARADLVKRLEQQVRSALQGARDLDASYAALVADYQQTIDAWPAAEGGTIDAAAEALRARLRESLAAQSSGLAGREEALVAERGRVEELLRDLPKSELEVAEPLRQRQARAQVVEFLLTSQQEAKITAAATSAGAVLIDPAVPPLARSFPKATMMGAIAVVLGLIAGCALALLNDAMRGALHTEAEVERVSGLTVLGAVPDYLRGRTRIKGARGARRFLPVRDDPDGPQAEAYRAIRAALRLALGEGDLRTLATTSCVPGEGKTVTNADLAMVFASHGRRVLLVDADLRKPQVHGVFEIERSPGLGEVLEGRGAWRDCVRKGLYKDLDVLPAGRCEAQPGELLAAPGALALLEELKAAYDLVVFDLPPAVVVADVAGFAHELDAVVLVYRWGGVPGRLLSAAVARLGQSRVRLIGVILNAVYVGRGPGGEGYGYGYGYSDGKRRGSGGEP